MGTPESSSKGVAPAPCVATMRVILLVATLAAIAAVAWFGYDHGPPPQDPPAHFYAARCCPARGGETLLCVDGTKAEEYKIAR